MIGRVPEAAFNNGPLEPFYDKSWKLDDVVKVD